MAIDRREHVRYEPTSQVSAILIWQDETGGHQTAAQLIDLSNGGCALNTVEAPVIGAPALVRLPLSGTDVVTTLKCRVVSRNPTGDAFLLSIKFEQASETQVLQLKSVLATSAYRPLRQESALARRKHWRVPQWAAYLTVQQLPVMPRSKLALQAFEAEKGTEPGKRSTNSHKDSHATASMYGPPARQPGVLDERRLARLFWSHIMRCRFTL